jgi:hypothetical protein
VRCISQRTRKRDLREWMREVVESRAADPSEQEAARLRLTEIQRERSTAAEMAVKGTLPEDLFRQEIAARRLSDCRTGYRATGLNQAVFQGFWIAGREVRRHRYRPFMEDLKDSDLGDPARSNREYVAGAGGFEPPMADPKSAALPLGHAPPVGPLADRLKVTAGAPGRP